MAKDTEPEGVGWGASTVTKSGMLLETVLADFSSDESCVLGQPGMIPFSWEVMPGKPQSPTQSECSGDGDGDISIVSAPDLHVPMQRKHHHNLNHHPPPGASSSGNNNRHYSGELYSHPNRQLFGELWHKTFHKQYSGELLPQSRKNPHPHQQSQSKQASPFVGPSQLDFSLDSRSPHGGSRQFGKASSFGQLDLVGHGHHIGSVRTNSHMRIQSEDRTGYHPRNVSFAADENLMHENFSFQGEAGNVPFEWESEPGRPKSQLWVDDHRAKRNGRTVHQLQLPPARLMLIKESDQAKCSNSSSVGSRSGCFSPNTSKRHYVENQGRLSGPLSSSGTATPQHVNVQHHLKVYPGDIIRISRLGSFEASKNHSRHDSYCSVESEEKDYVDESHVSPLECLPSPQGLNGQSLSHHIGSPADTPRRQLDARSNSSASASPFTDSRISMNSSSCSSSHGETTLNCLSSFHSSSLHSFAPTTSINSSSNFMASCLTALEVALHSDREVEEEERNVHDDNSDRHDDSFVSLESGEGQAQGPYHGELHGPRFVRSPLEIHQGHEHESERRRRGNSHRWSGSNSQLEPEYHTMDFYCENGDDRYKLSSVSSHSYLVGKTSTEPTSSPESVSTLSQVPIPRGLDRHHQELHHSNDPRRSLDEYSWRDRRFLQDQPSSWVEEDQGDDIQSSNMSSECNISLADRQQDVNWDDQQLDMNFERAEEVVRGTVDGLRFTYSPVSSAFVFTKPPISQSSQFENEELMENQVICFSPPNTMDTEISQRFSISLDYATSICSEDSLPYSIGRSSDVTELGISRVESWSRIARGASAVPMGQQYDRESGMLGSGGGYGAVVEESSRDFYDTPEVDSLNGYQTETVIRKRSTKKSGSTTCLPFRSILRNFKAFSLDRSRLGPQRECNQQQSPMNWTPAQSAQTAISH